jgi:hypothetical protein
MAWVFQPEEAKLCARGRPTKPHPTIKTDWDIRHRTTNQEVAHRPNGGWEPFRFALSEEKNVLAGRFCPSNARISLDMLATIITSWPTFMSSGKKVTLIGLFWPSTVLFFYATLNLGLFAPRNPGAAAPLRVDFLPVTDGCSRTLP